MQHKHRENCNFKYTLTQTHDDYMQEYSNSMNKTWLTWYRDDWDILIGHDPWRAALLHIEVSRLEKPPAGTHRGAQWDGAE